VLEVSLKDPVLHATAGVTTSMVEVLKSLYSYFLRPFVYLRGEDVTWNSVRQREGTAMLLQLHVEFPAGQGIYGWLLDKGLHCCIRPVREPFKRRDIVHSKATAHEVIRLRNVPDHDPKACPTAAFTDNVFAITAHEEARV